MDKGVLYWLLMGFGISFYWFGEVFVKREMFGFQRKCCQKICQNPCSCFGYRLSYNQLNEVIQIGEEPYDIKIQMYRRNQEKITSLRLPKMGLKVSFG